MSDILRKDHVRLRRRILYGQHEADISERISQMISLVRKSAWGKPDMTANVFKQVHEMVSILYNEEPIVTSDIEGSQQVIEQLQEAGFWTKMKSVQRDTSALREMAILVEPSYEDNVAGVTILPVSPDVLDIKVHPRDTSKLLEVRWSVKDDEDKEVILEYIPQREIYRAIQDGMDISESFLGGTFIGEAYPYRDSKGTALMPWILYRAQDTGSLWNSWTGREAVEATLQLGVLYTFFMHIIRNAAWAQRYAVNAIPVGADIDDEGDMSQARANVVSDPSTILILKQLQEGIQPSVGSLAAPIDSEKIISSIRVYETRILDAVIGADVSRTTSDIRSGYSLAVSRDSLLQVQKAMMPLFKKSDIEVLKLVAAYNGIQTSNKDWSIFYPALLPATQAA